MAQLIYIVTIINIVLMCVLAEESYSNQYDKVNAGSILQDNNIREQYYGCLMGTSPCPTEDAKYFAEVFSEALQSNCEKCTEPQKAALIAVRDWYTKNNPAQWEALVAKSKEDQKKKNAGQ